MNAKKLNILDLIVSGKSSMLPQTKEEKSVIAIKKMNKMIETDAQIIVNRIALLRQQELRSWKKIEEAKKKTKEIYLKKLQAEERGDKKEVKPREEVKHYIPYTEIKRQEKERKDHIMQALSDQRHNEMLQIKKQREINEHKREILKKKILEDKRSKSQSIKEQKASSTMKKNEYFMTRMRQFWDNKSKEVTFQSTLKEKKLGELMVLEKMEMELLSKLQYTQDLEKTVIEQLEEAMRLPLNEYRNKYLPNQREKKMESKRSSTPMIALNQDTSLRNIQKSDMNQTTIDFPEKRRQTATRDRMFESREERSNQGLEKAERIKRIYGRPKRDRERSLGRESYEGSFNGSYTEEKRDSARDKKLGFCRGAYKKFLDISLTTQTVETKKTEPNQNRSLLIDIGR